TALVGLTGFFGVFMQWRRAESALGLAARKVEAERQAIARLEQGLYYSTITLADREIAANNLAAARALLDRCTPELRRWEWTPLRRAPNQHTRVLSGPHTRAFGVAFSPDGRLLAAAYYDGLIRVRDPQTGRETRVFRGHTGPVHSVGFSPDGGLLASTAGDDD